MATGGPRRMSRTSEDTATEFPRLDVSSPGMGPDELPSPTIVTTEAPAEAEAGEAGEEAGDRPGDLPHVHYALNVNTQLRQASSRLSPLTAGPLGGNPFAGVTRSDTELSRAGVRRRSTRANTFKTIHEFDEFNELHEPGWRPGAEPGVDTSKPDSGHAQLNAECQVTIVDFSQDKIDIHDFDNAEMIDFLQEPQPSWVKCRWINVNGLSWDVIQALGNYKNLHRLAIEDIMNTKNRTKVDWYQHHAFMIFTCQKLVQMIEPDSSDDEDDEQHDGRSMKSQRSTGTFKRWWANRDKQPGSSSTSNMEKGRPALPKDELPHQATGLSEVFNRSTLCTLQRYQASSNEARNDFMERHSALAPRGLAVTAEQVAMFITSDNTVIAFFEQSADDVEKPILARLSSPDTILRQSCDASMVGQAVIDAIIDMAIPVASCYADAIADLELEVLLHPSITQTRNLYIIQSEVNKMTSLITPITSLISALRDHKTVLSQDSAMQQLQNPLQGVVITPMTYTYLGDVYDHCILISENLSNIRKAADGLIDLIFNTISAYQNESMKQLTVVTIIFLPLTFLTGYFGQNFTQFAQVEGSVTLFWKIALPVTFGIILILMRDIIMEWVGSLFNRRRVWTVRRRRKARLDRARAAQRNKHVSFGSSTQKLSDS